MHRVRGMPVDWSCVCVCAMLQVVVLKESLISGPGPEQYVGAAGAGNTTWKEGVRMVGVPIGLYLYP